MKRREISRGERWKEHKEMEGWEKGGGHRGDERKERMILTIKKGEREEWWRYGVNKKTVEGKRRRVKDGKWREERNNEPSSRGGRSQVSCIRGSQRASSPRSSSSLRSHDCSPPLLNSSSPLSWPTSLCLTLPPASPSPFCPLLSLPSLVSSPSVSAPLIGSSVLSAV